MISSSYTLHSILFWAKDAGFRLPYIVSQYIWILYVLVVFIHIFHCPYLMVPITHGTKTSKCFGILHSSIFKIHEKFMNILHQWIYKSIHYSYLLRCLKMYPHARGYLKTVAKLWINQNVLILLRVIHFVLFYQSIHKFHSQKASYYIHIKWLFEVGLLTHFALAKTPLTS